MRWTSESPAVWPPDAAWQRAWQSGVRHLLATTVDATGQVIEVPWLRVEVGARVSGGRLQVDLGVRGLGVWWPTLAPLFAAGSSKIQQGLDGTVHDLAEGLTQLPTADTAAGSWIAPPRPSAEERAARAQREVEAGMAEIGRRQHAADEVVRLLPWWRRTRTVWQRALDELPAASWPPGDALPDKGWPDVEGIVTWFVVRHPRWRRGRSIDTDVETVGEAQLRRWQERDRLVSDELDNSSRRAERTPWLATPWSTMRHLLGAATEDEARARTEALVAGQVS